MFGVFKLKAISNRTYNSFSINKLSGNKSNKFIRSEKSCFL